MSETIIPERFIISLSTVEHATSIAPGIDGGTRGWIHNIRAVFVASWLERGRKQSIDLGA